MALNVYILGALELTADQKEKIGKIVDERNAAARTATRPSQDATQEERAALRTATAERNTKANNAITALLTDAQKKKMEELKAGATEMKTKLGIGQRGQGAGGQGGRPGGGRAGGN
jgi:Spy/CpxP family protein refolding chaperone